MAHFYYHHHQPHHRQHPHRADYPVSRREQHASVDPLLAHHSHPMLEFDVSLSPNHIMLADPSSSSSSSFTSLTPRHLDSPAVIPPQPFLRITTPLLHWPIDVHPASPHHSSIVTVADVLHAIYHTLRRNASSTDWHACPEHSRPAIHTAYKRRCRRQHSHSERVYEESRGLRRVDWLTKNIMFHGLRPAPGRGPDHWEMLLHPGEKSVKFVL